MTRCCYPFVMKLLSETPPIQRFVEKEADGMASFTKISRKIFKKTSIF